MSSQQGWHLDQDGRSLTPIISVSSRKPSPETVPRARPANFARPFRENNKAESRRTPLIDRNGSHSDIGDATAAVPNTELHQPQQSLLSAPKKTTMERPNRPSQLKLAARLPSVREIAVPITKDTERRQEGTSGPTIGVPFVREPSINQKGKQIIRNIRRNDSNRSNQPIRESETLPAGDRDETIRALSAAIAAGFDSPSPNTPTWQNMTQIDDISGLHTVPFPDSPTSVYTHESFRFPPTPDEVHDTATPKLNAPKDSEEPKNNQEMLSADRSSPFAQRSVSTNSTNPLLGLGIEQHTTGVVASPEHEQGTPIDTTGEEADTRQSITSLPELIRRATRLASNLDRGKTASRLGLEDLLWHNNKRTNGVPRESTYSDVLVSFPAPGNSTPPQSRQQGVWSGNEKGVKQSRSRRHGSRLRPERRCCGLSLKIFLLLMILLVLLVAAAVLVPIFLILVPKERRNSTNVSHCPTSFPCQNGGVSIIDNGACSCICVNGFTGNQCRTAADPECVTADLQQGSTTYENATIGSDILSVLSQSRPMFNVPLNTTVLLSMFAANNISCSGENSLVQFNTPQRIKEKKGEKRFIVIPGLEPEVPALPVPSRTYNIANPEVTAVLSLRDSISTSSSASDTPQSTASSAPSYNSAILSTTTSSSSPISTMMTTQQNAFAEVVVLFVLTQSRTPSIAVNAQQLIERYFISGGPNSGNTTVQVGFGASNNITANFAQFSILLGNGTMVGGGFNA